ncbi:hypothetical protein B0H16DRAFT_1312217, partial [Mycena metata]
DLGDGYVLLRAKDRFRHIICGAAGRAIRTYLESRNDGPMTGTLSVARWARLQLPNGQIARSAWKEGKRPLNKVRMARNVKFFSVPTHHFGEIQFFFRALVDGVPEVFALLDHYSDPDEEILTKSYKTIWLCDHGQGKFLIVIPVKTIFPLLL